MLYFIQHKLLEDSPLSIALFLQKHSESLNKTEIGDYLSSPGEYNIKILHAYVDSQDYSNMEFSEAIRFFLSKFRLPGEAQKIDRLMEKFADRYTKCNSDIFSSADAAYVLGFSVIMLNTDLHNPNILPERKMTLQV